MNAPSDLLIVGSSRDTGKFTRLPKACVRRFRLATRGVEPRLGTTLAAIIRGPGGQLGPVLGSARGAQLVLVPVRADLPARLRGADAESDASVSSHLAFTGACAMVRHGPPIRGAPRCVVS